MDNRRINVHPSILQVASMIKNNDKINTKERLIRERKKRERNLNYTKEEMNKLIELAIPRKDIIENKIPSSNSLQARDEVWLEIEKEFNKNRGKVDPYRDRKTLRLKYHTIKKSIRVKWNIYLQDKNKYVSPEKPKFSLAEKKVIDVILGPMEGYFCGFNKQYDNSTNNSGSNNESIVSDDIQSDHEQMLRNTSVKEEDIAVEETNESEMISEEDTTHKECYIYEETQSPEQDPLVMKSDNQRSLNSDLDAESMKKNLEIEILKQELRMKKLQNVVLEQEIQHKNAIHELEKAHFSLKINMLRDSLE